MTPEKIKAIIKDRIEREHRKHPSLDWAAIAASKIYSELHSELHSEFEYTVKENEDYHERLTEAIGKNFSLSAKIIEQEKYINKLENTLLYARNCTMSTPVGWSDRDLEIYDNYILPVIKQIIEKAHEPTDTEIIPGQTKASD